MTTMADTTARTEPVIIDIDARRREAQDVPIVVRLAGEDFHIQRSHVGLRMISAATAEDLIGMMRAIFDDDRIGDTIDLGMDEIKFIMDTVNKELGFDKPGEALASPSISLNTTMLSRPTSTDISV